MMKYIENSSNDPRFNLALEEVLFHEVDSEDDGYFLLWRNEPSIIIGRFQNTLEEINAEAVRTLGVNVVRRMSGGGAVYHDLGNLNFTFILQSEDPRRLDFRRMTEPIVLALRGFGVNAGFNSRNDLVIEDRKFSGNAQYMRKGRFLHHGTILFDSDLEVLGKVLQTEPGKYQSKGVKSIKSRVTNVRPWLPKNVTLEDFWQAILETMKTWRPGFRIVEADPDAFEKAEKLAEEKYGTWEWNYGRSPEFDVRRNKRFDFGKVDVRLNVQKGIVTDCRIYGDFFGNGDIRTLQENLKGVPFREEDVARKVEGLQIGHYIRGMDKKTFLELLFS
jgi:lipoate-protein ligase A